MASSTQVNLGTKSYTLSQLIIVPASGLARSVDVTNLMVELSIFEDLYAPCLSGALVIGEAKDLIQTTPMTGFDYLQIVFSKPESDQKIKKVFRIYSIEDRGIAESTQVTSSYTIKFTSEELMLSEASAISKSYKGKNVTAIVKDILQNQMKVPSAKMPDANFENTTALFDIIVPNMSPFRAINMVVNRSIPPHLFFENMQGYNLKSVDTLVTQDAKVSYHYGIQNLNPDTRADRFSVIRYEVMDSYDSLRATRNGMFAGYLNTYDLLRWTSTFNNFSYDDYFAQTSHLEDNSFTNGFVDRFKDAASDNFQAFRRFYPTNLGHDSDPVISSSQPNVKPALVEQWMMQRQSTMEQLHYFRVKMVVPGNPEITVGDVINFGFPSITPKSASDSNANLNPYYTGKFLVTAIRHKINFDHYEMIVEISKDSFATGLPGADNTDATLNTLKNS